MTQTGDRCPKCREGQMRVRTSVQTGDGTRYVRYFRCNRCGAEDKSVVNAERVIRRAVSR